MDSGQVMSRATLPNDEHYKVIYAEQDDTVVVEIGGTSLKLDTKRFMRMNEMMRKAAARLVMQTENNKKRAA